MEEHAASGIETSNASTQEAFVALMQTLLERDPIGMPPPVVTFWCGAGFSKAWDPRAPTDGELFSFDVEELEALPNLRHILHVMGWEQYQRLDFERFKALSYAMDMQVRYPDIRNRYIDSQNLGLAINEIRALIWRRFHARCDLHAISDGSLRFDDSPPSEGQQAILDFFSALERCARRSGFGPLWPLYHFITTNYDFTLERLQERIEPSETPVFDRFYRGITPSSICGRSIWEQAPRRLDRNLLKINGGFELQSRSDGFGFDFDYRARDEQEVRRDPPLLILPSQVQDYGERYFQQVFPKAVRLLRETSVLVIVGYSMPPEDALLRFILRQLAESPDDARGKHVFVVDTKNHATIRARLEELLFSIGRIGWPREHYYSGKFEHFCAELAPRVGQRA